jgi:hypothetical protein
VQAQYGVYRNLKFIAEHASGYHSHSVPFVDKPVEDLRQAAEQARQKPF